MIDTSRKSPIIPGIAILNSKDLANAQNKHTLNVITHNSKAPGRISPELLGNLGFDAMVNSGQSKEL